MGRVTRLLAHIPAWDWDESSEDRYVIGALLMFEKAGRIVPNTFAFKTVPGSEFESLAGRPLPDGEVAVLFEVELEELYG